MNTTDVQALLFHEMSLYWLDMALLNKRMENPEGQLYACRFAEACLDARDSLLNKSKQTEDFWMTEVGYSVLK